MRADALIAPRDRRDGMFLPTWRIRRGYCPDEGQELLPLRRGVSATCLCHELGHQREEEGLRREEDDVLGGLAGEEALRGGEGGGCVLDAAVGCGDEHLRGEGAGTAGEGEKVEIHLRGEAFGDVGWRDPSSEGDEVVCDASCLVLYRT